MNPIKRRCYDDIEVPICPEKPFDCRYYHVTREEIKDDGINTKNLRYCCPFEWEVTLNVEK